MLVALGALMELTVFAHLSLFGRAWYVHTLIAGSALVIVGVQVIGLGVCGRAYGVFVMGERDPLVRAARAALRDSSTRCSPALALVLSGLALGAYVLESLDRTGFGTLGEERLAIVAMTLFVAGIQVFFTAFLVSLLGLRRSSPH